MSLKWFFPLFLCFFFFGCEKPVPPVHRPSILVSIGPYQFLAEKLCGRDILVQTVVPQGMNPHTFEPTSKQVNEIAKGKIWFRIGEPFEEKIVSTLQKASPSLAIFDLRQNISLLTEEGEHALSHSSEELDRHVWLSPKLLSIQAEAMERALEEQFPEQKELLAHNLSLLKEELRTLDAQIREILKPVEQRALLVSHAAFGYFCRDYDLQQLSVEYEGKDPRPKHLERLLQEVLAKQARFALALPQHNNKGAQVIAERLRLPVHWIDPYSPDYPEMLLTLAKWVAHPEQVP